MSVSFLSIWPVFYWLHILLAWNFDAYSSFQICNVYRSKFKAEKKSSRTALPPRCYSRRKVSSISMRVRRANTGEMANKNPRVPTNICFLSTNFKEKQQSQTSKGSVWDRWNNLSNLGSKRNLYEMSIMKNTPLFSARYS